MDRRLKKYNISNNEYNLLKIANNGGCEICNKIPQKECIDHDHDTGTVRGLLCNQCNSGLGFLQDDLEILIKAVSYLRKHNLSNEIDDGFCAYYSGAKKGALPIDILVN